MHSNTGTHNGQRNNATSPATGMLTAVDMPPRRTGSRLVLSVASRSFPFRSFLLRHSTRGHLS